MTSLLIDKYRRDISTCASDPDISTCAYRRGGAYMRIDRVNKNTSLTGRGGTDKLYLNVFSLIKHLLS